MVGRSGTFTKDLEKQNLRNLSDFPPKILPIQIAGEAPRKQHEMSNPVFSEISLWSDFPSASTLCE